MDKSELENNRKGPMSSNSNRGNSGARKSPQLVAAEAHCRQLARSHYENFVVASIFLPRSLRQDFYHVYAYCRTADDLADLSPAPEVALSELRAWRQSLREMFAGHATHPVFVALRDTVERRQLHQAPFERLLDAFEQDQVKTRYASFDELLAYCDGSANPVGHLVLQLAGIKLSDPATSPCELTHWSNRICTGLQLANHWQDLARDYRIGRIYLPQDEMRQFGVNDMDLAAATAGQPLRQLMKFQCDRAESWLREGLPLVNHVPTWLAKDLRLFVHGGLATVHAIRQCDYDVLKRRPEVSRWTQARLLMAAYFNRLTPCN